MPEEPLERGEATMATRRSENGVEPDRLQSVRRSLAVLEALAARPEGATPKELGLTLGLHLSTCYRLLNTLVSAGYVARDPGGLFRLGSRVAYLNHGYLAGLRPPPEALPFLKALQLATGETAILCQQEGDLVVTTATVDGNRPGSVPAGYIGLAAPAHAIAAGRVLLAGLPAAHLAGYLDRASADPDAVFPLPTPGALQSALERIRRDGYALDRGEGNHGVCCIAAPVLDASGAVEAALVTVAPCGRFRQEEPALVMKILAVAQTINALRPAASASEANLVMLSLEPDKAARDAIEAAMAEVSEAMSRVG